jgi:hypothetical protein
MFITFLFFSYLVVCSYYYNMENSKMLHHQSNVKYSRPTCPSKLLTTKTCIVCFI